MKTIKLSQGKVALVDDEDYERVNQHKWYAYKHRGQYYAQRNVYENGKQSPEQMHRFILESKPDDPMVDHKDNVGLNNQRSNLRPCTNGQNMMNRKKNQKGSSIYKGVHTRKDSDKFFVRIQINGKKTSIGFFENENDAGRAYNDAAIKHYGEFAKLNVLV